MNRQLASAIETARRMTWHGIATADVRPPVPEDEELFPGRYSTYIHWACDLMLYDRIVLWLRVSGREQARNRHLEDQERSPDESRRFIQKLNELTGGDEIQINRKYRPFWRGVPRAKILMLTNEVLSLSDNSGRLASRTLLLPFTVSFAGREDQRLRDKLAPELPGILLWAIDGLRRLLDRMAFTLPAESAAEIAELYGSTSPVRSFAEIVCDVDQSQGVQTSAKDA